jgi:hypothetical protein
MTRYQKLTRRIVGPPKNGPKDRPSLPVEMVVGVAAAKVPHVALYTIRTWTIATGVIGICTKKLIKGVLLECSNSLAEQSCADQ